jgi:hypothetical protein
MLDENDVIEAVCLHLLEREYSIVQKSSRGVVDIVARDPQSKAKLLVSATGGARSRAGGEKPQRPWTEYQVFRALTRSIASALMIRHTGHLNPGDQIALAFPDLPAVRKYLSAEKPVMECLGVRFFLVTPEKNVVVI